MQKKVLITGGAGFIGCHTANHYASQNCQVTIYDNLSRKGTAENAKWLKQNYPQIIIKQADIRDSSSLNQAVKGQNLIFHFASQVAVTTSITNPREDFEINTLGTFNVLEAMRLNAPSATLIYSSTNKVYGGMEDIKVKEGKTKYYYQSLPYGIPENRFLDFHSPYGCSKGAGDQYVRDYHRIYGLNTIVFRQSCIFGTRQFGIEDQGWLAWFTIALLLGKPITLYGNGKQVRDVLYVDDLIAAFDQALKYINVAKGEIYNVGGGIKNTLSLLEALDLLQQLTGKPAMLKHEAFRPGDQPVYISDIRKAEKELHWQPKITAKQGIIKLIQWSQDNKKILEHIFS